MNKLLTTGYGVYGGAWPPCHMANSLPASMVRTILSRVPHDPTQLHTSGGNTCRVLCAICPLDASRMAHGTSGAEEVRQLAAQSSCPLLRQYRKRVSSIRRCWTPDIERKVRLTGGHIAEGECLPRQHVVKWLSARTPMPSVYLCGACTHPGGSVIGINGRNAAMAVLSDTT